MLRSLMITGFTAVLGLTVAVTTRAQTAKPAAPAAAAAAPVTVVLETAKGTIEFETLPGDAPKSVERFLELARRNFYRQQRFHWVQTNLVQAGDPQTRDTSARARAEWGKGGSGPGNKIRPLGVAETSKRPFARGIVALAYITGSKPETADSQFFIMKAASPMLNGKYAVIGRVTKGMAVVDKIEKGDVIKMVTVK